MDAVTVESCFRVDGKAYLPDLKKLVVRTEDDLRVRSGELADVHADLTQKYNEAVRSERTLETFESWRDQYLTQVAVGWILSCVFLRYLEDNALVGEVWLAGVGERLQQAHDRHQAFFQTGPTLTDRDYLLHAFETVAKLPGCGELFGKDRNPLWLLGPSGDMAKEILLFFQTVDPASGKLLRTFGDPHSERIGEADSRRIGEADSCRIAETRFLGDLYQDLSEAARKRYALLQTPDFVEEFILDRTLEPAIELFGIDEVRMLDPTCGSGHFLLGSFARLLERRHKEKPSENERDRVQKALDGVYGVDLNPFAVAIARFRLLVAALEASGISKLRNAPNFKIHVAAGDSLLHGRRFARGGQGLLSVDKEWLPDAFGTGDFEEATAILSQQYHAVVGNPPYILDKDKAHNAVVRERFSTCHRKFSLAVPFKEVFFEKALDANQAGFVGMITANSFMKREFGKKLIEDFFPTVHLTHVIDTSGAYIPGHGTPTVILFGRNREHKGLPIRAVLGIRGEPSTPEIPANGKVWSSIVRLLDETQAENEFVTIADLERTMFHSHPWSIGGGGAGELKEMIENASERALGDVAASIGFMAITGEDEAFLGPLRYWESLNLESRGFGVGTAVRDWAVCPDDAVVYMYDDADNIRPLAELGRLEEALWPLRTNLQNRLMFGKLPHESGLAWYEYRYYAKDRSQAPFLITFAFVATHNHFVLDRGGKVFNRTAPVIKLPPEATVDDHLALLGLLNSSVACFWLKQVCFDKGATSDRGVLQDDPEKFRFEFDGTKLKAFPIPHLPESERTMLVELASALDEGGKTLAEGSFTAIVDAALSEKQSVKSALAALLAERAQLRMMMVRWQEELDWLCYELYGLSVENSAARSLIWRHEPSEMPSQDPDSRPYRLKQAGLEASDAISAKRLEELTANRTLAMLEVPEFKRRWFRSAGAYDATNLDDEKILAEELQSWLLTKLENIISQEPTLTTTAALTDRLRQDADFVQVAELYAGRDDLDLFKLVTDLVMSQDVPYLSALRYKETGLRKREQWEATWELQRREDAGSCGGQTDSGGKIPVPPKYGSGDFLKSHYWTHRGKLDVPKERFISYPLAEKESDPTPVIGWAGWNHAQQAQALASYLIERREDDGWTAVRLTPLLAGLLELLPWLKQWHNDIEPDMGVGLGDFYQGFLEDQTRQLALTEQHLRDWRPPAKTKGGGRKKKG